MDDNKFQLQGKLALEIVTFLPKANQSCTKLKSAYDRINRDLGSVRVVEEKMKEKQKKFNTAAMLEYLNQEVEKVKQKNETVFILVRGSDGPGLALLGPSPPKGEGERGGRGREGGRAWPGPCP